MLSCCSSFSFFGNIPLSLLWLEESDCKNEEGEELNNRHRSVRRSSVRWSSSSLLYYVGHMRASMIYHRFICAPRSVRACDPDEKNWADRSIQRSAAMKRRGRPTDRPMCALDWAFCRVGWGLCMLLRRCIAAKAGSSDAGAFCFWPLSFFHHTCCYFGLFRWLRVTSI